MWSEPEASLMLGQAVVVYEVDADMAACLCARVAGVPLTLPMGYVQCRSVLDELLDFVDEDHDDARNDAGNRGFDVDSALQVTMTSSHSYLDTPTFFLDYYYLYPPLPTHQYSQTTFHNPHTLTHSPLPTHHCIPRRSVWIVNPSRSVCSA